MSENMNWLERVSAEANESSAEIKPEGVGLQADEAVNEVGGDERLTNEGKTGADSEAALKDDTVVDDNPKAKEAEGEITTSTEDNDSQQAPDDVEVELTEGEAPVETPAEEPAAAEAGEAPVEVEPVVEPVAEPEVPVEVPAEATPVEEAPAELAPAEAPVEELPAEVAPAEELPVAPVEEEAIVETPVEEPAPVVEEPAPVEANAVTEDGAAGGDTDGGELPPVEGGDEVPAEVAETIIETPAEVIETPVEGGDAPTEEIPVAIDPVLEIQEGTAAAIADAQENPEGGLVAPTEGEEPAPAEAAPVEAGDTPAEAVEAPVEEPVPVESGDAPVIETPVEGEAPVEAEEPAPAEEVPVETEGEEEVAEEDFDCVADTDITEPMDSIDKDVESLGVLTKSLEGYQELLKAELGAGRAISPALAQSVMIGLKSLREPALMVGQPSVEDFSDPTGKLVVSTELAKGLGEKAAMASGALLEAAKRLWEQLLDMLAQIKHNVPALADNNKALADQLAKLKDGKGGKVSVKGAARLFIGDSFGGDVASNYSSLGKFAAKFLIDYPKAFARLEGDLADAVGNGFLPNQWGLLGIEKSKAPESFGKYDNVYASPTLLGNGRLVAGKSTNGDTLADVWKIEFVKNSVQIEDSATEVNLPSVANLRQITAAMGELIKHVPEMADADRGAFKIARESITKLLEQSGNGDASTGLVRSLTTPSGHLVGHVVNTLKVGQAFVAHCIKLHQGAAEA